MSDVMYKFDKEYYVLDSGIDKSGVKHLTDMERIVVRANTTQGQIAFARSQRNGSKRDYRNIQNELADLDAYVADNLHQVSFTPDESVSSAIQKIDTFLDKRGEYNKFDREITNDADDNSAFYQSLRDSETYHSILHALTKFEPNGIYAIMNNKSYPFNAALHDFAIGVSRKETVAAVKQLPAALRRRLIEFCKKHNYILSHKLCEEEYRSYKDSLFAGYRGYDQSDKRVDMVMARAADDVLRDALMYKYYQRTGNSKIFLEPDSQRHIDRMSDKEFVEFFGWRWMQNYTDGLQVIRRIQNMASQGKDITYLISQLNKTLGGTYYNQNIIRLTFDTLQPYYNKFKQNKAVTEFVSRLASYTKDMRLAKHMAETFGLTTAPKPNKDKVKSALQSAARRVESGDGVSDLVILDKKYQIARDYAMIPTDETFGKVKAAYKPTKTQQKIVARFGTREK